MKNLRVFDTTQDFNKEQEAMSGTGKFVLDIYPGFAYIRETPAEGKKPVRYNPTSNEHPDVPSTDFGNVVYLSATDNKLNTVWWEDYTEDMGEKVGLIVVPEDQAPDGNARMIAFGDIMTSVGGGDPKGVVQAEEPDVVQHGYGWKDTEGGGSEYIYMSKAQSVFNAFPTYEDLKLNNAVFNYKTVFGDRGALSMPDLSTDAAEQRYPNPDTQGEWYRGPFGMISPYSGNGAINPTYRQTVITLTEHDKYPDQYNIFSDFSGYTWTYVTPPVVKDQPVVAAFASPRSVQPLEDNPYDFPHSAVAQFYTNGTQPGDWYIPAAGEMGYVAAKFGMIQTIMKALCDSEKYEHPMWCYLNGREFDTTKAGNYFNGYWTSSLFANSFEFNGSTTSVNSGTTEQNLYDIFPAVFNVWRWEDYMAPTFQNFYDNTTADCQPFIRPMAMYKNGQIMKTTGTITSNGHLVSDDIHQHDIEPLG